jgi:hypothetical protein
LHVFLVVALKVAHHRQCILHGGPAVVRLLSGKPADAATLSASRAAARSRSCPASSRYAIEAF